MTLIQSKNIRPSTQSNDILHFLQAHPFVKQVNSLKDNHFLVELAVTDAATEVFVQWLEATDNLVVDFVPPIDQNKNTLTIRITGAASIDIINDFTLAFKKVSQYLEYLEVKKEYASGYVPTHLSQWLVEGNLLGQ